MKIKDLQQLRYWLSSGASLRDVQHAESHGLCGNERFTENARRAYVLLWTWSAPRFSGVAGAQQERFYRRHGGTSDALWRRYERARAIADKIRDGSFKVRLET